MPKTQLLIFGAVVLVLGAMIVLVMLQAGT